MFSRISVFAVVALTLIITIAAAPVAARDASPSPDIAARQGTGTVSGTVQLDGTPLEGVEVWVGEFSGGALAASHYACTDASGHFEMTGVALNTDLRAAVGIEVNLAQPCSNPLFLDLGYPPRGLPLLTQYWDHRDANAPGDSFTLTAGAPDATLAFDVSPWPVAGYPLLINTLVNAIEQFHDGRSDQAIRRAGQFIRQVDRLERRGALTATEAGDLRAYADNLINEIFTIALVP